MEVETTENQDLIKFKYMYVSDILPILWLGEDNWKVERLGRLIKLEGVYYPNGLVDATRCFIVTMAKMASNNYFDASFPDDYIIAGGVPVQLMFVKYILYARRRSIPNIERKLGYQVIPASGLKEWTYVAVCDTPITKLKMFEELSHDEQEEVTLASLYDPPLLFTIDVKTQTIALIDTKK